MKEKASLPISVGTRDADGGGLRTMSFVTTKWELLLTTDTFYVKLDFRLLDTMIISQP
jgi:hypothetical protein